MTGYEKIYGEKDLLHDDKKKVRSHIPNFQGPCPTIEQYQDVLKQSLIRKQIDIQKIFALVIGTQDVTIVPKKHWKDGEHPNMAKILGPYLLDSWNEVEAGSSSCGDQQNGEP